MEVLIRPVEYTSVVSFDEWTYIYFDSFKFCVYSIIFKLFLFYIVGRLSKVIANTQPRSKGLIPSPRGGTVWGKSALGTRLASAQTHLLHRVH